MRDAIPRVAPDVMSAIRRSIDQVREYQTHIMPEAPSPLRRPGVELGLRFTHARQRRPVLPRREGVVPSSLIMLAVPAQVAG